MEQTGYTETFASKPVIGMNQSLFLGFCFQMLEEVGIEVEIDEPFYVTEAIKPDEEEKEGE